MRVMVAIDDSFWVLHHISGPDNNDEYLLNIIHVMEPFPTYMLPGAPAVFPSASIIRSVNKAQEENASTILTRALDIHSKKQGSNKNIYNRRRDPKEMICDVAEQMQVDLIVIGSRGLGKIKRALIGSVSNYVIHHAKWPVLVIKAPTNTQVTSNA